MKHENSPGELEKPGGLSNPVEGLSRFYLIVTPGLEGVAEAEVRDWLAAALAGPDSNVKLQAERGGISLEAPLALGLELNRVLKVPTRILLRLADFGCRDFPKLFKKMQNLDWQKWVPDSAHVEFHATSKTSRVKMKKRIEETCSDGRMSYLKKRGVAKPVAGAPVFSCFVRFEDDVAWISLDTSGELLHKRGLRPLSSEAPLRETMASSLLRYLESFGPASKVELVDPMTGGGTFLMEAALMRAHVVSRSFAFELMPNQEQVERLRASSQDPYEGFLGFDTDPKTLAAAGENLKRLGESRTLRLIHDDFFAAQPLPTGPERWVIANPPYGERIRVEGKLSDYYERLFLTAERVVRPERALFLLPEKVNPKKLKVPSEWVFRGELKFQNGGLPVAAVVFSRRSRSHL